MKNFTFVLGMSLVALISMATSTHAALSDVQNEPYREAIETLYEKNMINGYPDGSFRADQTINRAEFTKIVISTVSTEQERKNCQFTKNFSDVDKNEWFAPYVCMAVKKGIINGYPDGTFQPKSNIGFTEAAKIIAHAFSSNLQEGDTWYSGSVNYLSDQKAIPITIPTLKKKITRGEMAEMLWRIDGNITTKKSVRFQGNRLIYLNSSAENKDKEINSQNRNIFLKMCQRRIRTESLSQCMGRMMKNQ